MSRKNRATDKLVNPYKDLALPTPVSVCAEAPDIHMTFQQAFPRESVIVVLGAQGEGKTSLGMTIMEYYHNKGMGGAFHQPTRDMGRMLPGWVKRVETLDKLPENSVCVVDEAHTKANARRTSSAENVEIAALSGMARQRGQTLIYITHFSRKLDPLELAEAKRWVFKRPTGGQMLLDRMEMKPFTARAIRAFQVAKGNSKSKAYVVNLEDLTFGMVNVKMAEFWSDSMSVAMKNIGKEEKKKKAA